MLKIRQLLLNNIELKIFSILLSILIWYVIIGQDIIETIFYVPVEFRNLPPSLEMVGEYRNILEVTVKGPSAFIKRLSPQDVRIILDLSGAQKGEKSYYAKDFNIDLPFGLTVKKVNPPATKIIFDVVARKQISIKLVLQGNFAYGYMLASSRLEPNIVLIEGIQTVINELQYINTDPINVNDLDRDKDLVVGISGEIPGIRFLQSTSVNVHLDVEEVIVEKLIKKVQVELSDKAKVITYSPHYVDISILGPMRFMDNINTEVFLARIETRNLSPGTHSSPVIVVFPDEFKEALEIADISPPNVTVRIR